MIAPPDYDFAAILAKVEPDAKALIASYPESRSALIPIVHRFQQEAGWVPPEAIAHTAAWLGLTPAEVESTVSFYTLFFRRPVGRYVLQPCRNLSCQINGAEEIAAYFREKLGIDHLQTSADGLFSYEEVECLAACDRAPCMQVNLEFVYDLTREKVDALLEAIRAGTFEIPPLPQSAAPGSDWHVAPVTARKSAGAQSVPSPNDPGGIGDKSGATMLRRLIDDPGPIEARPTRERLIADGPAILKHAAPAKEHH
jgi:NADH-quinone oxidoreductase E subunit